ncbi:MAG: hypothetical protein JWO06_524 [Bacteroidota bacterium]|nr:hypothetical protein [Bacteroidota bacterium]
MKKILITPIMLCFAVAASSQTSIKFCVEVEQQGKCQSQSSEFTIGKEGGTISFLLMNQRGIGATNVMYRIFKLEDNGTETYSSTVEQKIEKNWTYAWQDVVFYDEGTYKVKVFDTTQDESLLCSGFVKILTQ